jgi:acetyl esterase/lipase
LFGSRRLGITGRRVLLEILTAAARSPRGTRIERLTVAGVPAVRVVPPTAAPDRTLIYLHGGAYSLGSAWGYRGLAAHLAAAAGMTALLPDYSRAPDAQYPIALEEMVRVYSQLLADGLDPKNTVIVGDSAGGGLRWRPDFGVNRRAQVLASVGDVTR